MAQGGILGKGRSFGSMVGSTLSSVGSGVKEVGKVASSAVFGETSMPLDQLTLVTTSNLEVAGKNYNSLDLEFYTSDKVLTIGFDEFDDMLAWAQLLLERSRKPDAVEQPKFREQLRSAMVTTGKVKEAALGAVFETGMAVLRPTLLRPALLRPTIRRSS